MNILRNKRRILRLIGAFGTVIAIGNRRKGNLMKYATFFAPNLLMAISFVAVGLLIITNLRNQQRGKDYLR